MERVAPIVHNRSGVLGSSVWIPQDPFTFFQKRLKEMSRFSFPVHFTTLYTSSAHFVSTPGAGVASFRSRKNQLWQIVLSKNGVAGGYVSIR